MTPAQKKLAAMYRAIGTPEVDIRKALGLPALPPAMKHGTRGSFTRGCRCTPCSEANRAYLRQYSKKPQTPAKRLPFTPPRAVEPIEEPVFASTVEAPVALPEWLRASVDEGLVSEDDAWGATRPEVVLRAPSAVATRGSCSARCAETGLRCRLPLPHANHASERGPFLRVAVEGQYFARKAELERIAFADGGAVESLSRKAAPLTTRQLGRAHAGDVTADDRSVEHNRKTHRGAA